MRVEWEVRSQNVGPFLECLPQRHSRHTLAAGIESVKEQYRLFFLHIGLQRYSKYGRKPPIQQLSVFFLTKIAQISHLNSFNSLYSQRSISSLEGSFKRYFDINRFSSMPEVAYSTISLPTAVQRRMPTGGLSSSCIIFLR